MLASAQKARAAIASPAAKQRVAAGLQKQPHDVLVAVLACHVQALQTRARLLMQKVLAPNLQQKIYNCQMAVLAGDVETREVTL